MTQPIICALTPDALRERRDDLLSELAARATSRLDTADGHAFTFAASSETLQAITRVIGRRATVLPVAALHARRAT